MSPLGPEGPAAGVGGVLEGIKTPENSAWAQSCGRESQGTSDREAENLLGQASGVKGRSLNKGLIFMVLRVEASMAKDHN